jgi:hypothetical protein
MLCCRGIGPGQTKASRFLLTNSSTVIGWRAAYIGDITIGTGKNAVRVIDRNLLQMRPFTVIPVHSAPIRESRLSSGLDSLQPGSRANGRNGRGPAVDQEVCPDDVRRIVRREVNCQLRDFHRIGQPLARIVCPQYPLVRIALLFAWETTEHRRVSRAWA